jgi:hypothetical protein
MDKQQEEGRGQKRDVQKRDGQYQRRDGRYKRDERRKGEEQGKKKEKHMGAKKCPFCGYYMRCRGASGYAGETSWKCRNKKCGRTVWKRSEPKAPTPLVSVSRIPIL